MLSRPCIWPKKVLLFTTRVFVLKHRICRRLTANSSTCPFCSSCALNDQSLNVIGICNALTQSNRSLSANNGAAFCDELFVYYFGSCYKYDTSVIIKKRFHCLLDAGPIKLFRLSRTTVV